MSGIFGVLDPKRQTHQQGLLGMMGKAMAHRDWYAVQTYEDPLEGVGLGRVGIGIFSRAPQPVWNEAHTVRPGDGRGTLWAGGGRRIPYHPQITLAEAVEESGRLLHNAVRRLSGGPYRPGVFLSGGLDSRAILGMIERRPVVSANYGVANCRDVYYARWIARVVGSDHHWFDLPNGD